MEKLYNPNTPQWTFYAWASFATAVIMVWLGLWHLPVDLWIKGYLAMGSLFLTGSAFTLSKTMRDNQEFAERSRMLRGEDRSVPIMMGMKELG
jgi:hypothetical protein